jgi:uncharacterized protein
MLYEREVLTNILAQVDQKELILLTGARQTGKTTLLKQVQSRLSEDKPSFFLNLENLEFVKLLNNSPENLFKIFPLNKKFAGRQYVFVDEIQYLDNPTNFLKYIYDEYNEQIQLIVSGSSAFYIDEKFRDSLAGRKRIFYIYPLSLRDFLIFKGRSDILEFLPKSFSSDNLKFSSQLPLVFKKDLEILLEELMIYGGYPRVVLAQKTEEKKGCLRRFGFLVH